jgi:hypothetical protein
MAKIKVNDDKKKFKRAVALAAARLVKKRDAARATA